MFLAQIPIISDLPEPARNFFFRALAVLVALILIILMRRLLVLIALSPLKRIVGGHESRERLLEMITGPIRLVLIAVALVISAQLLVPEDPFFRNLIGLIVRVLLLVAALMFIYRLVDLLLPTGAQLASFTGIVIEDRLLPFLRV